MSGPEARHLATVCRLRAGDELCLFNGDGREYPARVREVSKKSVELDILAATDPARELDFSLEVAAPLPKGNRIQFLMEKLTELGVTTFVPLLCHRSVIDPGEGKLEKLKRHVIEACKQCGRNLLLQITEPVHWAKYTEREEPGALRILASPAARDRSMCTADSSARAVRCAVGPEGGFTEEELKLAEMRGWKTINLGPRILRIETAAIVLATMAITERGFSRAL